MELNNIQNLQGRWKAGWALDLHTLSSTPLDDNHFETVRTEIGELLFHLKYRNDASKIPLLADIIVDFLKTRLVTPYLSAIIPIPPSDTTRTSQPVYEIAKLVGEKLKLLVDCDYLLKIRPTSQLKSIDTPKKEEKYLPAFFKSKTKGMQGKKYYYLTIYIDLERR